MAIVGNTVRLRCEFSTFAGAPIDPSQVNLNIYNSVKKLIFGPVPMMMLEGHVIGVFEYDYVIPADASSLIYYEFTGTTEGTPIVARGSIPITWI